MPDRLVGDYHEVRQKLLELGYLDGRIRRFVLKGLLLGGPIRGAVVAGWKAALLGGPILGGLLAGAAVAGNRPLLRVADSLVLWGYFSILGSVTLFLLNIAAASVVGAMARRRRARPSDTLQASLFVALPTPGYLILLWWRHRTGQGLAADLLFLAAALGATLAVAWLAGLVSLAGIIGRTGQVPDRGRGRVLGLVLLFLPVVAAALGIGVVLDRGSAMPVPPSPFEPAPVGDRLLLVGVDGMDGGLLEALEPRGAVNALLAAMTGGAVFPKHRSVSDGIEPPGVWTTLLTGMPASLHGVRGAGAERLPGVATPLTSGAGPVPLEAALRFLLPVQTVPTSARTRRVRTLWEIVGLKEPAAAVGWWASWPADGEGEPPTGYVVSDRVLAKLLAKRPPDRDTFPASLFTRLENAFSADRSAIERDFEARFPHVRDAALKRVAWESFLIDAYHWRTTRLLLEDPAVRAAFVYLPGLDILRYRTLGSVDAKDVRTLVGIQDVWEAYARWLDGALGEALADRPGWRSVLVADPGRAAPAGEGFVLVVGGPGEKGCVGTVLSDLDVAPLVLRILGFPRSAEMPGTLPVRCLSPGDVAGPAVSTFGRRGVGTGTPPGDYDSELVEYLKSLGYLR